MWFIQKQLDSLKSLSEIIGKTPRISLDLERRQKIKTQLMNSIKLSQAIPVASLQIVPDSSFRAFLKEKLITLIEFESRKKLFVLPKFTPMRLRFLGAVLTLAIFVIGVFNLAFTPYKAEAAAATTLDEVIGSVVIIRDSQAMTVKPGFVLKTDDVIKTGKDSQAVIKFLDQSVSRLSENTEVQISKLFINPLNKTETLVEVVLNRGRLWSRVINLIDDFSHFQVKAGSTLAVAKKKAAFDVEMVSKKKAKVSAMQNYVDVVVETDENVVETTVVKGFSAEVKTNNSQVPQIVHGKTSAVQSEGWIADNLEKDKQYIETVKKESQEQRKEQLKGLPQAISLMPVAEEDKQKQNFAEARKKFSDAELLLSKGVADKARESLDDFYARMENILKWLQEYEVSNPSEAFVLKMQIVETLNNYKKQLALILPTEILYPLKEAVSRAQLLFSSVDSAEKTQQKLSDAEDKLIEAHDLAEIGEVEAAKEQVEAYTQTISDVVSEIKQMPKSEKEQAVNVLLEKPLEGLKTLETIQESPPAQISPPAADSIGESVSVAKTEAMSKIGEVVVEAQKLNTEKLEEIKNKTIDINGKPVDVKVTQGTVTVKTGDTEVIIDKTRPVAPERGEETGSSSTVVSKSDLESSVLPQAQP